MVNALARKLDPRTDAIDLLKQDHRKLESLFEQFEKTEDGRTQRPLARKICEELLLHMELEEKLFYEQAKQANPALTDDINEGFVEHEAVRRLVQELQGMNTSDEFFKAKMTVAKELVEHHVREEEREMMPKVANKTDLDLIALGEQLKAMKQRLG